MAGRLRELFEPSSVVVIGASATPHKPGNDVIRNILANGYEGALYLINPKGGEIMGKKVMPSIEDMPEGIDLGIILLPAPATVQAVKECAAKGVKALVLAAGGFSEVNQEGQSLQGELSRTIHETGITTIGPNTSGHTSTPHKFTSSFFPLGKIPRGNISYIAQTGNFATHTMRYIMTGEHFGVARVVGLGNKIDVNECDALTYLANDSETKAILVYLESLEDPRRFVDIARGVTRHKPVILLKGGSTTAGSRAAMAHTAALASDDRILDGALRQAGVVRVHKYTHLVTAAKCLAFMPPPLGNRVSFLAPSGAMLVCLSDLCLQRLGLRIPQVDPTTQGRLQEISPPFIRMRNPVDIWPAASVRGVEFAYREGMEALLKDPNIDAVVPILLLTEDTGVPPLDFIVDLARKYPRKPVYVSFSGDKKYMEEAKSFLEPQGIPTFPMIEEPFEALSILVRCRYAMDAD
jgi:acyl-CoA synthetase (NDP forming)